jgi:hypothetical protein
MKFTALQVAIIITLHQQPDYTFVGNEKSAAERMVSHKMLKRKKDGHYEVTPKAEKAYQQKKKDEENGSSKTTA